MLVGVTVVMIVVVACVVSGLLLTWRGLCWGVSVVAWPDQGLCWLPGCGPAPCLVELRGPVAVLTDD